MPDAQVRGNGAGDRCRASNSASSRAGLLRKFNRAQQHRRQQGGDEQAEARRQYIDAMAIQSLRRLRACVGVPAAACVPSGHLQSTATVCRIARANAGPGWIRPPPPGDGATATNRVCTAPGHMPAAEQ